MQNKEENFDSMQIIQYKNPTVSCAFLKDTLQFPNISLTLVRSKHWQTMNEKCGSEKNIADI